MPRPAILLTIALLITLWTIPPGITASAAQPPVQRIHVVQAGDTLWSIGRMHQVPADAIATANRLQDPDRVQIADVLVIPAPTATSQTAASAPRAPKGAMHRVQSGNTLWSIARRHGTSVDALLSLNRIGSDALIQLGQTIALPERPAGPAVGSGPKDRAVQNPSVRIRPGLLWPSRGVITSRFGFRGRRHHHGIDIAAPVGTPIAAARDGQVQFVGRMGGYGLLVILDHGNGLTTWYGHASRILVEVGQRVRGGQTVALVGATGNVSGPNVHFEVRRDNVPLDPLQFLRGERPLP